MALIKKHAIKLLGKLQSEKKGLEIQVHRLLHTHEDQRARSKMGGFIGLILDYGLNAHILALIEHVLHQDHKGKDDYGYTGTGQLVGKEIEETFAFISPKHGDHLTGTLEDILQHLTLIG